MTSVSIQEAQNKLTELIHHLSPGEAVVITENDQPVALLTMTAPPKRTPRVHGNCKGMITLAIEDEEHLKDFVEYMP